MNAQNSDPCQCKCHFGGAVSCPSCKKEHEQQIHAKKCCNN